MTSPAPAQCTSAPLAACRLALRDGLLASAPHAILDGNGHVGEASQNLIEGVLLGDFETDLLQGDGNEMGGKFRAAHSSSALAVNTFAPFKALAHLDALRLPGGGDFTRLQFEQKCPHGLVGRRSPNLDVLADGPSVVAVESKLLEPLSKHAAKFSRAYDAIKPKGTKWFREMDRLRHEPCSYHWLDAAQLVKHAFGIAHTFPDKQATLLYLFWEPSNPEEYPFFAEHRAEVKRFADAIEGGRPGFVAMSYPELWESWDAPSGSQWLRTHVDRLRNRYEVAVESQGRNGHSTPLSQG